VQDRIEDGLIRSLESTPNGDYLVARQLDSFHLPDDRYHLSTAPIRDASRRVTGAVVTLREFTIIHMLVDLLGKVIRAGYVQPALEEILKAIHTLGHDQARIFLLETRDGQERLVSRLATGYGHGELNRLNTGEIVLVPRTEGHHTWASIDKKHGGIFIWKPGGTDGESYHTSSGLEAEVVTNPDQARELGKQSGDSWTFRCSPRMGESSAN
jgi:hypothetical protein